MGPGIATPEAFLRDNGVIHGKSFKGAGYTALCPAGAGYYCHHMIVYVGLSDQEKHFSEGPVSLSHLGLSLSKFQVTAPTPGAGPNSAFVAAQLGQGGAVNLCYLRPLSPKMNDQF